MAAEGTASGGGSKGKSTRKTVICTETEIQMQRLIYKWEIGNFDRICTPDSEEFDEVETNPFWAGEEIGRKSKWEFLLMSGEGFLQLWLHLRTIYNGPRVKDISLNMTVSILTADGSALLQRRCNKNQKFTCEENGWGMGDIIKLKKIWEQKDKYLIDNKLRLEIQLDILGEPITRVKRPNAAILRAIAASAIKSSPSTTETESEIINDDSYSLTSDEDDELTGTSEKSGCDQFKRDMKNLFRNQNETDFTIKCGGRLFPVHKLILSTRSKIFASMFKPDTPLIQLSDDTTQTRPNYCDVVEIDDFPPTTVERLLEYIYTGCIKLPSDLDDIGSLLAAGDKYELEELKNQCLHAACIQMNFENVGEIAILAYRHNADLSIQREIRQFCQSNWNDLLKSKPFKECLMSTPKVFFDDLEELQLGDSD